MDANLQNPFERDVAAAWPTVEWSDVHVVLAVSGGPDSAALLRAVRALKERAGGRGAVHVAHLNHGFRGAEAAADVAWLTTLCRQLELPLHIEQVDLTSLAADQGGGWEAAARTARYDFLTRVAEQAGARWVAVGHTRDDQVETVLYRLIRGTGLAGLAGMRQSRQLSPSVTLVRPLLKKSRADVLDYLAAINQDYRTDATNADLRFTRNRLRHRLLPLLRTEFNTDIDAALLRLAGQAHESQQVIDEVVAELLGKCVRIEWPAAKCDNAVGVLSDASKVTANRVQIDCRSLEGRPPLVVREVCRAAWRDAGWPFQAMGFDQWQQLATLVASESEQPQFSLPGNIQARCRARTLVLHQVGRE
jgi:tRNA(Ile)-lysidine synthase